jgi:hypothetical protein
MYGNYYSYVCAFTTKHFIVTNRKKPPSMTALSTYLICVIQFSTLREGFHFPYEIKGRVEVYCCFKVLRPTQGRSREINLLLCLLYKNKFKVSSNKNYSLRVNKKNNTQYNIKMKHIKAIMSKMKHISLTLITLLQSSASNF